MCLMPVSAASALRQVMLPTPRLRGMLAALGVVGGTGLAGGAGRGRGTGRERRAGGPRERWCL